MRFHYPLQKIVDLKESEKSQAEMLLSKAVGRLKEEEESLHSLQSEQNQVQDIMLHAASSSTTVSELQLTQGYVAHMEQMIRRRREAVEEARREVSVKQEQLTGKMVEQKVWSQAKDKAGQAYRRLFASKEQQELDEMATTRYIGRL